MTLGKFITFEGGEGAGKSTQIQYLEETLKKTGIDVVKTREPGGTPGGEHVRRLLKEGQSDNWDGISEALLLYAARRDLTEKVIRPALARGCWVLSDRFHDSTRVYQGIARGIGLEMVEAIHHVALGDFKPDLTIYLDISPQKGLNRSKGRAQKLGETETDRFERMGLLFHKKIYEGYQSIMNGDDRFVCIDATWSFEKIAQAICAVVSSRFETNLVL